MKSKEAMAWEVWCKSQEGIDCRNPLTLGSTMRAQQFLENRLWRAFMAGLECGRAFQNDERVRGAAENRE